MMEHRPDTLTRPTATPDLLTTMIFRTSTYEEQRALRRAEFLKEFGNVLTYVSATQKTHETWVAYGYPNEEIASFARDSELKTPVAETPAQLSRRLRYKLEAVKEQVALQKFRTAAEADKAPETETREHVLELRNVGTLPPLGVCPGNAAPALAPAVPAPVRRARVR